MTPQELEALGRETVCSIETAADALGCKRTLAYRLVRETGELCEGVRPIRVGRLWRVSTRQIMAVLNGEEKAHTCACKDGER